MVKSLMSKLSSTASSTLSIANPLGGNGNNPAKNSQNGHASGMVSTKVTAINGDHKYRNDPGRFFGDGVQFKAKLIGILEVGEARGDRMCQEALQDLKMAIRAAGEHKQRITIHVTIDGLRLRDEKTGDSLYHHPVHKISFIAQDMTDTRAFGYIFGSPDSGHRFFGIKTDKAASQVVLAMRDLFQVVFELKKKEIELARQQIQSKSLHHDHQQQQQQQQHLSSLSSLKSSVGLGSGGGGGAGVGGIPNDLAGGGGVGSGGLSLLGLGGSNNTPSLNRLGVSNDNKAALKELSPESVADLVDLEQELSSLQRGINQMERITPNDAPHSLLSTTSKNHYAANDDPFGDSFTAYSLLPPPESGRSRHKSNNKINEIGHAVLASTNNTISSSSGITTISSASNGTELQMRSICVTQGLQPLSSTLDDDDDDAWLRELDAQNGVFDTTKTALPGMMMGIDVATCGGGSGGVIMAPLARGEVSSSATPTQQLYESAIPTKSVNASDEMAPPSISAVTNTKADRNSLTNSSSLTDLFQTALGEAVNESSNVPIKSDAFTDLDPLGTGRTRPYVDKKYFFQDLKNPPKKVLKDLSTTATTGTCSQSAEGISSVLAATSTITITALTLKSDENLKLNDCDLQSVETASAVFNNSSHTTTTALSSTTNTFPTAGILTTRNNAYTSASSAQTSVALCTTTDCVSLLNTVSAAITTNTHKSTLVPSTNNSTLICTSCPPTIITSTSLTNTSIYRFTNMVPGSLLTQTPQRSLSLAKYPSSSFSTNTTFTNAHTTTTIMPLTQNNVKRFTRYPLETISNSCETVTTTATTTTTTTTVAAAAAATTTTTTDPVMLPRDTDPFSPTRKKSDPFEEGGDIFSKLDPFEFEFNAPAVSISSKAGEEGRVKKLHNSPTDMGLEVAKASDVFGGHLQVYLPPESVASYEVNASVRSRPMATGSVPLPSAAAASSVFRQQTVDVLSSISNKKMPHLFGQSSRFSRRDSNSINMRRLQESDSLSENETAPEPPPRPDISSYSEPPPLPPKKQFNDIIIRPRSGLLCQQSVSNGASNRYEFMNSSSGAINLLSSPRNLSTGLSSDIPPIPVPSRRVGRSDGTYPGPGRPRKPGHTEDDYLAPLGMHTDSRSTTVTNTHVGGVPPLLPPPTQVSTRARSQRQQSIQQHSGKTHEIYENKNEIMQQQQQQQQRATTLLSHTDPIVPDITLSQLLTLSIDELAKKLNVSTSKLSTMTLVELTSYLSEFIEKSKTRSEPEAIKAAAEVPGSATAPNSKEMSSVFKINFDREATFVAKFDDTFGEHLTSQANEIPFEADFTQFDKIRSDPVVTATEQMPAVPPADRYAIFREIIDQELQHQETNLMGGLEKKEDPAKDHVDETKFAAQFNGEDKSCYDRMSGEQVEMITAPPPPPKIDTKITEVVAQAKDRYAALRDIILVENLFEKPCSVPQKTDNLEMLSKSPAAQSLTGYSDANDDDDEFNNEDQDLQQLMDENAMLSAESQQQRMGLVDSRGLLMEPSSSALTVEDDEDDDDEAVGDEPVSRVRGPKGGGVSSGDSGEKDGGQTGSLPPGHYEQLANSNQQLEQIGVEKLEDTPKISITQVQNKSFNENHLLTVTNMANLSGSKDDIEIDALMQRAISSLSVDSRDRNSPANSTTHSLPAMFSTDNVTKLSATPTTNTTQYFNDISASPNALQRSPLPVGQQAHRTSISAASAVSKQQNVGSSLPTQLTVVSQLIDVATKQIRDEATTKISPDSWATFDTPTHHHATIDKRSRSSAKVGGKAPNLLHIPPPPAPASNTSQNDTAGESPYSSDPREEAWHMRNIGGSNVSLGHQSAVISSGGSRRWHKKENRHTSSSSRDLSWDDEQGGSLGNKRLAGIMLSQAGLSIERHGYHPRYPRRMNSCDEDYEYEEDFPANRRDQRKFKSNISRSRDNFDLDSPSYYHQGGPPHHTWSPQDIEQARARALERGVYERNLSYAPPPLYDKRGIIIPPPLPSSKPGAYERRSNLGYEKRSKFYRSEYTRTSNSDFDEFGDALPTYRDEHAGSFEKLKFPRRPEYENVFNEERRTPPSLGSGGGGASFKGTRPTDLYMYERDRKSFDRESVESFESSSVPRRRRRSFGSSTGGGVGGGPTPDPYGNYDNRDEYHRYVATEKTRSLRKPTKSSRVPGGGDIDYDRDSDEDLRHPSSRTHIPGAVVPVGGATSGGGMMVAYYYRKKQRLRNKTANQSSGGGRYREVASSSIPGVMRPNTYDYVSCGGKQNKRDDDDDDDAEDYVDEEEDEEEAMQGDDDEMPTDEDKFERLNRRRHEMHQRIMESEQRRYHGSGSSKMKTTGMSGGNISGGMPYASYHRKSIKGGYNVARQQQQTPLTPPEQRCRPDYGYDDDEYEQTPTPRSNTSSALPTTVTPNASTKFSFDVGFESDFNLQSSPPPAPTGTASSCNSTPVTSAVNTSNHPIISKPSFRFSNDFSDRERQTSQLTNTQLQQQQQQQQQQQLERDRENRTKKSSTHITSSIVAGGTQKLRFDDNVKISQFDDDAAAADITFEDDFSKATFDAFENDEQWQEATINKPQISSTAGTNSSVANKKQQMRNSILQQRQQELIKKSESINIFAKKSEDPFEDDDFFKSPPPPTGAADAASKGSVGNAITITTTTTTDNGNPNDKDDKIKNINVNGNSNGACHVQQVAAAQQWDDSNSNFAKFDENM